MVNPQSPSASEDLQRIIDSSKRLGIEMDEAEAIQWLTAIATAQGDVDIVVDIRDGVFGHRVTMLDFSPERLAYFRNIGHLVEFYDQPGVVETALALSGSAAQSRIQTYPGDADFFERVNIKAATREEACTVLGKIMREKVVNTSKGPTYQLIEIKYGNYPFDLDVDEQLHKTGTPISWTPEQVIEGKITGKQDGAAKELTWEQAGVDPGWCKLDWVVADPVDQQLVNASNMLDVTWEAPDGTITPLDGYLDPYFQEVYLEAESIPIFTKLAKHVDSNALDEYVGQLENEIRKYLNKSPNYGKIAKRMYNIFRLTGRYEEAAYLRELFDEPTTVLYQVWSLIRTVDDTFNPDSTIPLETLLSQADKLILTVVDVLEGEKETEIIRQLLRLRDILSHEKPAQQLSPQAEAARDEVINIVNNFFYEKLSGVEGIHAYMKELAKPDNKSKS